MRFSFGLRLLIWTGVLLGAAWPGWAEPTEASLEEILGGFDTDPGESTEPPPEQAPGDGGFFGRHLDLTGSVSLGASYNVDDHRSSIGPNPPPAPGTDYGGVQRLRARTDLQADIDLPGDWKARLQAFGFYDFAYLVHGKDHYTRDVLDDYEFETEILDLWLEGSVTDWLDLKLGRQVVNWGRSDALRVTDVWNALNNREPGLVDIEELRLPSTMARADAYLGSWQWTALVVPEIRYDYNPPPGSDFFPVPRCSDLPPAPVGAEAGAQDDFCNELLGASPGSTAASQWGASPEFGFSLTGIFSGWDLSLYAARLYANQTSSVVGLPDPSPSSAYRIDQAHDRITLLGAGGNYTRDAWLFKAEFAFLDELDFVLLRPDPGFVLSPDPLYLVSSLRVSRLDWMAGIEYYGLGETTLALDLAHRHVIDYDPGLAYAPNYVQEDSVELALRLGSEYFNARLRVSALGLIVANNAGFQGGILRLWADYELAEALIVTGGYLHYFESGQVPFDSWGQNDRIFAKVKFSFP